ncbi:MAG TPA: DNA replication and repair protein RecF [Candidatus Peribacterales bacterium]|nr:DNA replication and repair protein RecF [Candidatus Peribacterales bacterium]
MRLLSLSLEHFRSYGTLEIKFEGEKNVSVLIGENATGKTNVLEAICVLSLLKSSRKAEDKDLIQWEKAHYRIRGVLENDAGSTVKLEVVSQMEPRKARAAFINDVKVPAMRYIGALPLITFTPDDLLLWSGAPGARRRLIDQLLCQVSQSYLQAMMEYEKVLKQRNTLLKQIRDRESGTSSLELWDEKLAALGALITIDRLQLFETLELTILRELTALGERPKEAHFHYVRKGTSTEESALMRELTAELFTHRDRDIAMANTTVGPHRDDFTLFIDQRDIVTFASRGQQRAALLSLLLLQASFLELRKGEKPILLLDDVFSELDEKHRKAILDTLSDLQVIMTAVEFDESFRRDTHVLACPLAH